MNREMRRFQKKCEKERNKKLQVKANKVLNECLGPCCYINNEPIYSGACVFLKPDNEIKGQYDWSLGRRIDAGHRFVILTHLGFRKGVIVIGLLSTSSYLNEENRLGIRLNGKYHNNKYVYMDAKNCWIINTSCIKSLDYNLSSDDQGRCMILGINNKFEKMAVHKGLLEDEIVNKYYNYYKEKYNTTLTDKDQTIVDVLSIKEYINNLPYSKVKELLEDAKQKDPETVIMASEVLDENSLDKEDKESYFRNLIILYLSYLDKEHISEISETIQRGY